MLLLAAVMAGALAAQDPFPGMAWHNAPHAVASANGGGSPCSIADSGLDCPTVSALSGENLTPLAISLNPKEDPGALSEVETCVAAALAGAFGAFWLNRQIMAGVKQ
jgi:hypothetical protein